MKWLLLALCLPCLCFSQAIKSNGYDGFLKKQRLELSPVLLHATATAKLSLSFAAVGSNLYLLVHGQQWGAATIDNGNELIFLFNNDSTVTVRAAGLQTFELGLKGGTYTHQYLLAPNALKAFAEYELAGIRKYSFKEFSDLAISRENKAKLQRASNLFQAELKKANLLKTLKHIDAKDVAAHLGDSVMFCSRIYNSRVYEQSANKPTVLDLQSDFNDPLVNVVVMDEHRKNFPDGFEKGFVGKDVCITGVVMQRNNIPYIQVQNREQIKLRSAPTLNDIALYVGDSVTVVGTVFSARFLAETATAPTLLNLGAPFPAQLLTVVIEKADRPLFEPNPETALLNKEIRVSGKVVLYKNKPQIVLRRLQQLAVLGDAPALPAKLASTESAPVTFASQQQHTARQPEAETAASFPGGEEAWTEFLRKNLQVPEGWEGNESKTVIVNFLVDGQGMVGAPRITRSGGAAFDKEVLRVLALMPRWNPRTKGGAAVAVNVSQPITFRRENSDKP